MSVSAYALSNKLNYFGGASSTSAACSAVNTLNPDQGCGGQGATSFDNIVKVIINIMSLVVGIASVIMIIVGGLNFVTSGGDSQKVATARNTILYAIVGLIIVALAQTIAHFTLSVASNQCPSNSNISSSSPDCNVAQ
jgi:hypothetical protein